MSEKEAKESYPSFFGRFAPSELVNLLELGLLLTRS